MKRLLVLAGLVGLLVVPAASASHSEQLSFYTSNQALIASSVSQQQSGVSNPFLGATPCGWDANDYLQRDAILNSALGAGASATDSVCLIADWAPHTVYTELAAASPDMNLTVSFSTGGSTTVIPTFDKRLGLWVYRTCVNVPTYQLEDPLLQPVMDSNGGVGVETTVTLTASNSTARQIAKIRYDWGFRTGTC